jgi:hypothetical protein
LCFWTVKPFCGNFKQDNIYFVSLRYTYGGTESVFLFRNYLPERDNFRGYSGNINSLYLCYNPIFVSKLKICCLKTDNNRVPEQRLWTKFPALRLSLGWTGSNILLAWRRRHFNCTWGRERGPTASSINVWVPLPTPVGCRTSKSIGTDRRGAWACEAGLVHGACLAALPLLKSLSLFRRSTVNKSVNIFLYQK